MAFWRFGFAQESGIDALLKTWDASGSSSSSSEAGSGLANGQQATPSSGSGSTAERGLPTSSSGSSIQLADTPATSTSSASNGDPTPTLEQLLEEEDLLQECKAGHTKLVCIRRRRLPTYL